MIELIHISFAGPERMIIDAKNRLWRFEDHRYCGPIVIDKNGDPKEQPHESSPFWDAVTHWYQQGKKIDEKSGICVWQKPTVEKLRHIGGRNYELVP